MTIEQMEIFKFTTLGLFILAGILLVALFILYKENKKLRWELRNKEFDYETLEMCIDNYERDEEVYLATITDLKIAIKQYEAENKELKQSKQLKKGVK